MSKKHFKIIAVDDEKSFLLLLVSILEDAGYTVKGFTDPMEALETVHDFKPDLIITDMKMPRMDGMQFMNEVKLRNEETEFIMITAFATVDSAVDAMKEGAADYITKPLRAPEQLRMAVSRLYDRSKPASGKRHMKIAGPKGLPPLEIIFTGMEKTLQEVSDVAPTDATVILYGETGTGKSLIAKVLHHISGRSGAFVDINCAAIPENLLESELFGYERGAFTGAATQKKGRFELAVDGTIFLDEVSEMSLTLQAKLLRVLQERSFDRLGSLSSIQTNARVVAATNRDLKTLVEEKRFREDLYYRLSVFPILIPPLRDRGQQIELIAKHLVQHLSARLGKEGLFLDDGDLSKLAGYSWPGNIRELENVIERGLITSKGRKLTLPDLMMPERDSDEDMRSIERRAIETALVKVAGNRKRAAGILGISLRSLQYKIKEYGISVRQE